MLDGWGRVGKKIRVVDVRENGSDWFISKIFQTGDLWQEERILLESDPQWRKNFFFARGSS